MKDKETRPKEFY